jgi:hypothetical protein
MTFTPERSDAIRAGLITVAASRAPRRRRVLASAGLVLAGVLVGGSAVAFAAMGTWTPVAAIPSPAPAPEHTDLADPQPGRIPGEPIVTVLGDPIVWKVTGVTEFPLTDRPAEATHARVTFTCTVGSFSWGTDAGGNNPSVSCDTAGSSVTAWYDFPLDAGATTFYVAGPKDGEAVLTLQYLAQVPTSFGVNENGQTYGVDRGDQGTPDLVFVGGEAPDGSPVDGYARAVDLQAFSPDHPGLPSNPEEALRWQREREERYPDGWEIPVFASDGTTRLGTLRMG